MPKPLSSEPKKEVLENSDKKFEKLDKELDKIVDSVKEEPKDAQSTPKEEIGNPPEGTGKPPVDENAIYIENFPEVKKRVLELLEEKKLNPGAVQEEDAGIVILESGSMIVIDNNYVPEAEARIILQTRKVVKEYLKLERMKEGLNIEDIN